MTWQLSTQKWPCEIVQQSSPHGKNWGKFILLAVHMAFQTSKFFWGQLNLRSIKSHGRQEGWECQLLITSRSHLERGSSGQTWLKIISKSKFPQHYIVSFIPIHHLSSISPHLPEFSEYVQSCVLLQLYIIQLKESLTLGWGRAPLGKVMDTFLSR